MTNLTRLTGKLFGETATATGDDPEIGQFGSAKAGTYVGTTDVATIQSLPAWSNGFIDAVTPNTQFPPLPEVTGAMKVLSYQENYLLQKGIPEWDSGTTYYTNDYCKYGSTLYYSLQDSNINHNPTTSPDYWAAVEANINNKITNCILEIPQDIKLELNSGTLTLKSGSKVYVPNGFEEDGTTPKFDVVTIENDLTDSASVSAVGRQYFSFLDTLGGIRYFNSSTGQISSGTTQPSGNWLVWYDTTNNLIKHTDGSGVWQDDYLSLPIAIFISGNGYVYDSASSIFNGTGYIGTMFYTLPNVKVLIPDGLNDDGTLKNIEYTTPSVIAENFSAITGSANYYGFLEQNNTIRLCRDYRYLIGLDKDKPSTITANKDYYYYATDTNIMYYAYNTTTDANWAKVNATPVAFTQGNGTYVTDFSTKQAVSLVDYNSLVDAQCVIETYINGNSWYRVWSDGWCEQGGLADVPSGTSFNVSFLKTYVSNCDVLCQNTTGGTNTTICTCKVTSKTTSGFKLVLSSSSGFGFSWYAYGYIA